MAEIKEEVNNGEELQLVIFKLDQEEYGVEITQVQEIIRMMETTRVPKAPSYIKGVINLRGKVIPVIDLKKRFGLCDCALDEQSRIIVVEVDDFTVGIVVDCVAEVLRIGTNSIEPTPPVFSDLSEEYIKGVGKLENRLLILLDINKILDIEELEKAG